MTHVLGIALIAGLVAIVLFLPRPEWPRPPKWMRVTAVAIALPLAVVAVLLVRWGADQRDLSAAPAWVVAIAAGGLALKLVGWACFGRVNPRSLLGLALTNSRPAPPRPPR